MAGRGGETSEPAGAGLASVAPRGAGPRATAPFSAPPPGPRGPSNFPATVEAGTNSKSAPLVGNCSLVAPRDNTPSKLATPLFSQDFDAAIEQTSTSPRPALKDLIVPSLNKPPTAFLAGNCSLGARCDNFGGIIAPPLAIQGFDGVNTGMDDLCRQTFHSPGQGLADVIAPTSNIPPCLLKPLAAFPGPVSFPLSRADATGGGVALSPTSGGEVIEPHALLAGGGVSQPHDLHRAGGAAIDSPAAQFSPARDGFCRPCYSQAQGGGGGGVCRRLAVHASRGF